MDNSSPGFRASANWGTSSSSFYKWPHYGADYRYASPQAISDPAWYSASLPSTGTYQVQVWYPGQAYPAYTSAFHDLDVICLM